jgi:carbamoyl-phosphate synthase large subunit
LTVRNILVSGASGIVGYGILRSLRKSGRSLKLVGTSIFDDSVAPAFCDAFEKAVTTSDTGYLDWLLSAIRTHGINMIIPGIDVDMYEWDAHRPELEASGATVMLNDSALIRLCGDKWSFYQRLSEAGAQCVIESSLATDFKLLVGRFGLPFLLKPRHGFGSKGIVRVDGEAAFDRHRGDIGRVLMAQPIVGNDEEEFTVSAFCDGKGDFHASMALRRRLSKDGFTDWAEVVDAARFAAPIRELCAMLRPIGPTNFQFRQDGEAMKLLEINPRISSSTAIRTAFGYNESDMSVGYFLDHKVPAQPIIGRGRAVRYVDEQIFHEDSVHF